MLKAWRAAMAAAVLLLWGAGASAAEPERLFTPAEAQADLDAMYAGLKSGHVDLYALTPKRTLDRLHAQTRRSLQRPVSRGELELRLQAFAAAVRMGHTRVQPSDSLWRAHRSGGGKVFPLAIRVVEGRTFVLANRSGVGALAPGDEILAMNGRPMREWVARTARLIPAETDYMAHSLLEFRFPALLWQEVGTAEAFRLRVRRGGGPAREVTVPARSREEMQAISARQPPGLDLDDRREARVLDGGIGYLLPGPFYAFEASDEADMYKTEAFGRFIDESFAEFRRRGVRRLLIDLRGNPGGDNSFSDLMIAYFADRPFRFFSEFRVKVSPEAIAANQARVDHDPSNAVSRHYAELYARARPGEIIPVEFPHAQPRAAAERFDGEVFLLIDRHSYSNTTTVAALVQDYGFGTVLGEPTADMATTYGAMETFTLPHSRLQVGFPKAHIVRPSGERRVRGVTPDVPLPSPVVQTQADEVLTAALAYIRSRPEKAAR